MKKVKRLLAGLIILGLVTGLAARTQDQGDRGPRMVGGWAAYPGGGITPDTLNF
jgi:hypothetical protein